MSLAFVSRRGSFEAPWIGWALLRDNVAHHLDGGRSPGAYEAIHRLGEGLGRAPVKVPAAEVHACVTRALAGLAARPSSDLALSERTERLLEMGWPIPPTVVTRVVGITGQLPWVPGEARTLGDVFEGFCSSLLELTRDAAPTDVLEVHDA